MIIDTRIHLWNRLHSDDFGVDRQAVACGTDYPRPGMHADNSYKQQKTFITEECAFLDAAQREQLLAGTALRVYRWD